MSTPAPEAGRPVALIIEDDQDTIDLLEIVLNQAGFQVIKATNGAEGIALAQQYRPVLATIDVTMPEMDGLEATRRIRGFSDAYIVIISSKSLQSDVLAGFDAGADDYVPKPIRPVELRARLSAVARRPATEILDEAEAWAPADEDAARSELLRQVAAGQAKGIVALDDEDDEDDGQDGREGMLELGMRFVGRWIEFRGLRINPARGIVVVDDRLVDLPDELVQLLEMLMYTGSRTLTARQLALRLRHQTEQTATTTHAQDERWVHALMTALRTQVGDVDEQPRWFQVLPRSRYRLVRPRAADWRDPESFSDDASA